MKQGLATKMNREKRPFTSLVCSKQQKQKLEELIKEAFQYDPELQNDIFSQPFDLPTSTPLAKSKTFPNFMSNSIDGADRHEGNVSQPPVFRLKKLVPTRQVLPSLSEVEKPKATDTSIIPFKRLNPEAEPAESDNDGHRDSRNTDVLTKERASKLSKIMSAPSFCTSSIPIPLPDAPWRSEPSKRKMTAAESPSSSPSRDSSMEDNLKMLDCFINASNPSPMLSAEPSSRMNEVIPSTSGFMSDNEMTSYTSRRFDTASQTGACLSQPDSRKRLAITAGADHVESAKPVESSGIELNNIAYDKLNEILRLLQLNKSTADDDHSSLTDYAPSKYSANGASKTAASSEGCNDKIILTEKFFDLMNEKDYHLSNDTNKTMKSLQMLLTQAFGGSKQPWNKKAKTTKLKLSGDMSDDDRIFEIDPASETSSLEAANLDSNANTVVSKKFNFYPSFSSRYKDAPGSSDSTDATAQASGTLKTTDLIDRGSKLPYAIPLPYKATTADSSTAQTSSLVPASWDFECSDLGDELEQSPDSAKPRDALLKAGIGRGRHVCPECGIRTRKPSLLKKHMITHADFRPFICCYCNISFKTKGNLVKHMKTRNHVNKCVSLGMNSEDDAITMITNENIDNGILEEQLKINKEAKDPAASELDVDLQPPSVSLDGGGGDGSSQDDKVKTQDYQAMLFQTIFDDVSLENICIS